MQMEAFWTFSPPSDEWDCHTQLLGASDWLWAVCAAGPSRRGWRRASWTCETIHNSVCRSVEANRHLFLSWVGAGGRGKRKEDQEGWCRVSGWVGMEVEGVCCGMGGKVTGRLETSSQTDPLFGLDCWSVSLGEGDCGHLGGQRRKQMSLQEAKATPEGLRFT